MSESVTTAPTRVARHQRTVHRIVVAARRLAVDRGLDGFTMDDLARECGVSRRTVFNHVCGKDDAVLGPTPGIPAEALAAFVDGGPHGSLVDDLVELMLRLLRERPETPQEVALARRALRQNPRLAGLAIQRLQDFVESSIGLVEQREGPDFDRDRFDVALMVVVGSLHLAMDRYLTGRHGPDLAPLLLESVRTARDLLA